MVDAPKRPSSPAPHHSDNMESYLLLAKATKGAAAAKIVSDATAAVSHVSKSASGFRSHGLLLSWPVISPVS